MSNSLGTFSQISEEQKQKNLISNAEAFQLALDATDKKFGTPVDQPNNNASNVAEKLKSIKERRNIQQNSYQNLVEAFSLIGKKMESLLDEEDNLTDSQLLAIEEADKHFSLAFKSLLKATKR